MSKITEGDLRYEYSWKATAGDNPRLIHKDARHLSRKEGYRSREKPTIGRQRRKGQARYLALS
ncbi:hypothetical protein EIM20_10340 [Pseudomonas aeruginosa]|nr:hypothetical protein EIM20_10340 [Pseudomonas aeruginosa]